MSPFIPNALSPPVAKSLSFFLTRFCLCRACFRLCNQGFDFYKMGIQRFRMPILQNFSYLTFAMFFASCFFASMFPCRAIMMRCACGEPAPCIDSVR